MRRGFERAAQAMDLKCLMTMNGSGVTGILKAWRWSKVPDAIYECLGLGKEDITMKRDDFMRFRRFWRYEVKMAER